MTWFLLGVLIVAVAAGLVYVVLAAIYYIVMGIINIILTIFGGSS